MCELFVARVTFVNDGFFIFFNKSLKEIHFGKTFITRVTFEVSTCHLVRPLARMMKSKNFSASWFYVKSFFGYFRVSKSATYRLWILIIIVFNHLKLAKLTKNHNSEPQKLSFLRISNTPKLISRKIWLIGKAQILRIVCNFDTFLGCFKMFNFHQYLIHVKS